MKIIRHIPAFCDQGNTETAEVNSFDELMNFEWVKIWKTHPEFYRFSYANDTYHDSRPQHLLMVELNEGKEWWVIGIVHEKDVPILIENLPAWEPKK